ncbi:cellulose synthase/poly-beta-1,6-N-acetylglucosamine synthase-like glycosyltransferase [Gracilibacillus halotolerans]|uniref:Cellulose synthase/poly-beta-1,6-N-acetylglucosamine synthase-like glycosyltransferase n=1 Tax=Gracilibacillus halotolerans TaxID=74386 RepID=A0A841RK14_9BACI|nr:glycosyltransferase [Gracilibacillus halotolerans]MBB6512849.1 cellulose synthase/poly-beta-1,6-N-acetylglucosamine synthase-like glycosyltransferase [Gracilibacillus halotolerans]
MANYLFYTSLIVIWIMLLYHMFLAQGGYRHFRNFDKVIPSWEREMAKIDLPTVNVFIPAHNEEVVIRQTLKAMARLHYPKDKLQIILICDNCSDRTKEIGDEFAANYPFIRVIETKGVYKGKGKSSALNYALKQSNGEVIAVYDADNTPERKAVWHLVMGLVNDQKAGAIVGKFRVINAARTWLTKFINIETITFQWMAQAGRFRWFRITTIPGTNFAIRRKIMEKLGGWDTSALTEDTELTIRVYSLGYHIRFFPAAITWEQEPETLHVWWRQRTRWARGNQYVVLKFLGRMFSLRSKKMMFDIIYFFFTYFLFFFGVILSNILFIVNLFYDLNLSIGNVALILWAMAFLLFLTEIMITLSIEKNQLTIKNMLYVVLMYFTYSQMWIALVIYALILETKRMIKKEENVWYKTERFSVKEKGDKVS